MGAELTSPCTWVKHLPTLLRKRTAKSSPAFMKIGDQKVQRTLRKQKVRGLLQDRKVPGTSVGTRAAEATGWGAGSAAGLLGERQAGLCERPGACLDQGGLNRKNFSKRKRK